MKFRGGEFSTGTMRNFQSELTNFAPSSNSAFAFPRLGSRCLDTVNSCARTFTWESRPLEGNSEIVPASCGYERLCETFVPRVSEFTWGSP
jgi:hypothetical protein